MGSPTFVGMTRNSAEPKHRHHIHQLLRLNLQALSRCRRLLHQRRVLLRHLIELRHRIADLADALALLDACAARSLRVAPNSLRSLRSLRSNMRREVRG